MEVEIPFNTCATVVIPGSMAVLEQNYMKETALSVTITMFSCRQALYPQHQQKRSMSLKFKAASTVLF